MMAGMRAMAMTVALAAGGLALAGVAAQAPGKTVWDGAYTAEQAKRGEAAYQANCAACHGESLAGIDVAPPLTGSQFLGNWNSLTTNDLFDRIKTTMPLNDPGTLSGRTVADIEAFILQTNGFPAGQVAIPPDPAAGIPAKILANKPGA